MGLGSDWCEGWDMVKRADSGTTDSFAWQMSAVEWCSRQVLRLGSLGVSPRLLPISSEAEGWPSSPLLDSGDSGP